MREIKRNLWALKTKIRVKFDSLIMWNEVSFPLCKPFKKLSTLFWTRTSDKERKFFNLQKFSRNLWFLLKQTTFISEILFLSLESIFLKKIDSKDHEVDDLCRPEGLISDQAFDNIKNNSSFLIFLFSCQLLIIDYFIIPDTAIGKRFAWYWKLQFRHQSVNNF